MDNKIKYRWKNKTTNEWTEEDLVLPDSADKETVGLFSGMHDIN